MIARHAIICLRVPAKLDPGCIRVFYQCDSLGQAGDEDEWDAGLLSAGLSALNSMLLLLLDNGGASFFCDEAPLHGRVRRVVQKLARGAKAAKHGHRCCWPGLWFTSAAPAGAFIAPLRGIGHLHIRTLTMAAVAFEKLREGINRRIAPLRRRSVVVRSFLTWVG